jgi:hypothetical protein
MTPYGSSFDSDGAHEYDQSAVDSLIVILGLFAVAGGGIVVLDAFIIRRLRKRG